MASSSGSIVSGSGVMYSATSVVEASVPEAANRTRSRSVKMPIGRLRPPSTTTIDPTRRSTISAAASAIVAERPTASTRVLIMSATVSALIARPSLSNRHRDDPCAGILQNLANVVGRNDRGIERHRKQLTALRHALDLEFDRQLSILDICGDTRRRLD